MNKIKLSKINGFVTLLIILPLFFAANDVSAETTFFDQNDAFIIGYSVTGGVVETEETISGGGCLTNWSCTPWSSCINEIQTRNCTKEKEYCYADIKKKPLENRSCSMNQLFDIKFELESAIIRNSNELISIISFESFGNVPTLVNLIYSILDSSGERVYSERGSALVTTGQIVRKNFENLNLPEGKYILILTTLYGDNVKDEFRQEFEVIETKTAITGRIIDSVSGSGKLYGLGVIALIILLIMIYKFYRRRSSHA